MSVEDEGVDESDRECHSVLIGVAFTCKRVLISILMMHVLMRGGGGGGFVEEQRIFLSSSTLL